MSDAVKVEYDGLVATATIDRPKALNALNVDVLEALDQALFEALERGVRALVVTGGGDKAFVAGADIQAMRSMGPVEARTFSKRGQEVMERFEDAPFVTIAAVNGFALGGGLELALACDIRIASDAAQLGLPEVTLGVIPGFGGTQRLARIVGMGAALDLAVTGRRISAEEALRLGLVSEVVPAQRLRDRARELAAQVASNGPIAVQLAKRTVRQGFDADIGAGLDLEAAHFGQCFATQDQEEGMTAFLEKRKAEFKGQ